MRVPGGVGVGRPRDAGDPRAGLDQPPRQEHALAVDVAAVGIAQAGVLAVELERAPGRRGGEQIERPGLEAVHLLEPPVARACRPHRATPARSRLRPLNRAGPTPSGSPSSGMPKFGRVGIAEHEQRIVAFRPSQPPKKPGCGGPPAPSAVMYGIET